MSHRLLGQRGAATVEFAVSVVWVMLAALIAWQFALTGWTAVSATNAARSASRAASRGLSQQEAVNVGRHALWDRGLDPSSIVQVNESSSDDAATVKVNIPIVVPGWSIFQSDFVITEHATVPHTG